jgi:hypothetical protein
MSLNEKQSPNPAAAETPQPQTLDPEQVVANLRALSAQIPEVTPLTPAQNRLLRKQGTLPPGVLDASINVIGASDTVTSAVGVPAVEVRTMVGDASRWDAVEKELKAMWKGVAGANVIRRQKIALIAGQAYGIGRQLARDPENSGLLPHVAEVKHQRKLAQGKKRAQTPGTPAPAPVPSPGTPPPVTPSAVTEMAPAAGTPMMPKA